MPGLQGSIIVIRGPIPGSRGPMQGPYGPFKNKVDEKRLVSIFGEGAIRPEGPSMANFPPSPEHWLRR